MGRTRPRKSELDPWAKAVTFLNWEQLRPSMTGQNVAVSLPIQNLEPDALMDER